LPDVGQQRREDCRYVAGCGCAQGGEGLAEDKAGGRGREMGGGVGGDAGAKGESQQMNGGGFGQKRAQGRIGGVGVLVEILWRIGAGAFAVSGVVEDERGDVVFGEQTLHRLPVAETLADAVEEEDCGGWRGGGLRRRLRGRGCGGGWRLLWMARIRRRVRVADSEWGELARQ